MDLQEDIKFIDATGSNLDLQSRLALSAGTCAAPEVVEGQRYCPTALIAAEPWRPPCITELASLVRTHGTESPGQWVGVVTIPDEVLLAFAELRSRVADAHSADQANAVVSDKRWKSTLASFVEYAGKFGNSRDDVFPEKMGIRINAPRLPTVTIDYQTSCLIGVHLDSWFNDPLSRRHLSPNRLVANLSYEPRYLLYLNISLGRLNELVPGRVDRDDNSTSYYIGREFMLQNQYYPLVRVLLLPGEAYLAPTENMMHEGSTLNMTTWDIHLAILGRFRPVPR